MNKVCIAIFSCLLAVLYSSATFLPDAHAQSRRRTQPPSVALPKAQFQSLMRDPSTIDDALPVVDGLHLDQGVTRKANDPTAGQPYQPGEPSLNGALVRWDKHRMPLRVWISEGKKLPEVPYEMLPQERVDRVCAMLRTDPASFDQLPEAPGFKPEMCDAVAEGFEQWRQFEKEGLLSFGFVDSPTKADVMVFFTDRFVGASAPGGIDTGGLTMGRIFTADQVRAKLQRGEPVMPIVMELVVSDELGKIQANATHEFGHVLGIKAHSPYREDIMYVNRVVNQLSAADKATIRALYRTQPKYWYY